MAHKVNPKSFRLGVIKNWDSRWFLNKRRMMASILEEDFLIRKFLNKKLKPAGLETININRIGLNLNVNIFAAKPGIIIGRGGKEIEETKKSLEKIINKHRKENNISERPVLFLNIEEVKNPMTSSPIVAQLIANDLEKRMPYRRVMKRMLQQVVKNRGVLGVKIRISGRLGGADIARSEWLDSGRMPLQTLRADIDSAEARAVDTFGTMGIKVWIYKGDVFNKVNEKKDEGEALFPKAS